jgi:S1-C subfamily serine protease
MEMYEDDGACPPPRRARGLLIYSIVAVFAAWAGVGTTLAVHPASQPPRPQVATGIHARMNDTVVYDKVEPGVVDVSANLEYLDETAEGTGFVIDATAGLVLTNNHVINGATSVLVTPVISGKAYQATVVGYDRRDDVAVLRLTGVTGLKAVVTGNSDTLTTGTQVLALGNEAGQGGAPTLAPGVISSMGRSIVASDQSSGLIETLHGMLQTSADIRPGDSGGPLANAAGEVIGIDTAAGSGGPGMNFAGYAIPINQALSVARQIAAGRRSSSIQVGMPAFLGVLLPDSTSTSPRQQAGQQARTKPGQQGQVKPGQQGKQRTEMESSDGHGCLAGAAASYTAAPADIAPATIGALVEGVVCGTSAARAGLVAGDVITSFGGQTVTSGRSLSAMLDRDRPGDQAALTWVAIGGTLHSAIVTLGAGPAG